ncbi:hypothetical protein GA0061096_4424 [Fictibacillus enclensis]|uniref:Uncharacterized protein n=1 Tax=Fictibacillus enclensis TaxID=1017270 RepID=A0A0V8IYC1_9BACL|nr:hypothetical protein [Fictibacillus enclensis]KSU79748.1 hypothetical protein AS030_21080 [Fictibacillus enclensis]SCC39418.1 hypothetical protein GA0061096_4424 [Fictibacillus enclensis]
MSLDENKKQEYVDRFTEKILEILIYEHGVKKEEAIELLDDSIYFEMLDDNFNFVLHHSPKYWAKKALEFQRQVEYA